MSKYNYSIFLGIMTCVLLQQFDWYPMENNFLRILLGAGTTGAWLAIITYYQRCKEKGDEDSFKGL